MSTSLQLKKDFVKPIIDLAFFILACISVSSFSSGVIKEPRYLKDLVKLMRTLLGKSRSSRMVAFEDSSFACFRVGGKYMASDFERRVFDPVCIMRPKRAKCLTIRGVAVFRSSMESKRKKLSST